MIFFLVVASGGFAAEGPFATIFPRVGNGSGAGLATAVRGSVGPPPVAPHLDQVLTEDIAGPQS